MYFHCRLPNVFSIRAAAATSLLATAVAAQSVTASITAATPLTVASNTTTSTQPAGPLPAAGVLQAFTSGGEFATSSWVTNNVSSASLVQWNHTLHGDASAGSHEVVISFQATAPAPARIEIEHLVIASPSSPVPNIAIDWDNDGTFDWIGGTDFLQFRQFQLTTQPTDVRVRYFGTTMATSSHSSLTIRALPSNGTAIGPAGIGCTNGTYQLEPSFVGTGVVARATTSPIDPSVLVIGTSPQVVQLSAGFPWSPPCWLFPSADVVVPFFLVSEIQIPLPAAVRPANLWVQRVTLSQGQLVTDNAYQVFAN